MQFAPSRFFFDSPKMDTDLQARIERLYETESLTDNLTDANAIILLQWAEAQLRANTDEALVAAALSTANQSDASESDALLAQAQTFLAQQLHAREITAARPTTATDAAPAQTKPAAPAAQPALTVSGAVGSASVSDTRLHADAAAASAPAKKARRPSKSKTKK